VINHRLEAELERLDAPFFVTEPLPVAGHADGLTPRAPSNGNGNGR
jgi:hypothetical protein